MLFPFRVNGFVKGVIQIHFQSVHLNDSPILLTDPCAETVITFCQLDYPGTKRQIIVSRVPAGEPSVNQVNVILLDDIVIDMVMAGKDGMYITTLNKSRE